MSVVLPLILQNSYFIGTLASSVTAIGLGINTYYNTENNNNQDNKIKKNNIFDPTSDYETKENFINITNGIIPDPPKIPNNLLKKKDTTLKIKYRTRYDNFEQYKRSLRNKNKRKRQKQNRRKKK